jgi:hypothetical protein
MLQSIRVLDYGSEGSCGTYDEVHHHQEGLDRASNLCNSLEQIQRHDTLLQGGQHERRFWPPLCLHAPSV